MVLPIYLLLSFVVVAFEKSGRYVEAAAVTLVAVPVLVYVSFLPGVGRLHLVERWAAGREVDRASALDATYAWSRGAVARAVAGGAIWAAMLLSMSVGSPGRPGRGWCSTGFWAPVVGAAAHLIAVHSIVEGALRPARVAIAGDTEIGDSLPRSRPTFAAWSNVSMLAVAFSFAIGAAMLGAVFDQASEVPVLAVVFGCVGDWLRGADHRRRRVRAFAATHSRPRRRN